jgi:hypothetical protein
MCFPASTLEFCSSFLPRSLGDFYGGCLIGRVILYNNVVWLINIRNVQNWLYWEVLRVVNSWLTRCSHVTMIWTLHISSLSPPALAIVLRTILNDKDLLKWFLDSLSLPPRIDKMAGPDGFWWETDRIDGGRFDECATHFGECNTFWGIVLDGVLVVGLLNLWIWQLVLCTLYCKYLYWGNRHGNGGVHCVAQNTPYNGHDASGCLR